MKSKQTRSILGFIALAMAGLFLQEESRVNAQNAYVSADGSEVLTRGPIHEAFAQPGDYNPTLGSIVLRQSPINIEEIPPDQRPEGDSLWIPGYWQWDDDREDHIWISGIWRLPPPDQSWVPGYWSSQNEGWIWTSGFWLAAEVEEVEYLYQPPDSLEMGPSSPAPTVNHLWAPGCWMWSSSRYAWRPGYWVEGRRDWIWEPSHYVRSPRGYIYVDGYWDRSLERRGVIFAPVHFSRPVYSQPNYYYTPSIVISLDILVSHLFVYPSRHHYVFGDYYDNNYSGRGVYPWFDYHDRYRGYSSHYSHTRWRHHGDNDDWDRRQRDNYSYRVNHSDSRPARSYHDQARYESRAPEERRDDFRIAAPLSEYARRSDSPIRYEKLDEDRRNSYRGKSKELDKYRDERVKWEAQGDRKMGRYEERDQSSLRRNPSDHDDDSRDRTPNRELQKIYETERSKSPDANRTTPPSQDRLDRSDPKDSSKRDESSGEKSDQPREDRSKSPDMDRTTPPSQDRLDRSDPKDSSKRDESSGENSNQPREDRSKSPDKDRTAPPSQDRIDRSDPKDSSKRDESSKEKSNQPREDRSKSPDADRSPGGERSPRDQARQAGEGKPDASSARERSSEPRETQTSEKVRIPKSPTSDRSRSEASRGEGPPARPDVPQADPKTRSKGDEDRGKSKSEAESPGRGGERSSSNDRDKDKDKDNEKKK